jgi:site-specific recombinase XerD
MGRKPHTESHLARRQSSCETCQHQESRSARLTPHVRTALLAGGELEQIQFLLGHASVRTTEHYLGCKQKLRHAVNDNLGLEDV